MSLLFTADENWAIGVDGHMLVRIKDDLKRFKDMTYGNIIVMGRRTLEALPDEEPLEGRVNIVFTRGEREIKEGNYIVGSVEELDLLLDKINGDNKKTVFVIGGGQLVKLLYDRCDKAYITKIFKSFERSDTSMINLDADSNWKVVQESEVKVENGLKFKYVDYKRKN